MKKSYKAIAAAMIGNALEYYDVMLYGFFATMLAPLFFPASDPAVSVLSSFATFAAGFIMRPLGGMVFGHIGDTFGRRTALVWSIFLVVIPTLTIGLLPTYETIGIAAPIILITCRLLQGLCVGGEYSGAALFVIEYAAKGREAFAGSLLNATGVFGGVLGTLMGFGCTLPFMPSWGWRIPFIVGAMIGIVGYHLRTKVSESPVFVKHEHDPVATFPLFAAFREHGRNIFCAMGIGAAPLISLYMASVYMGHILTTKLQVPLSDVMLVNLALNTLITLTLPLMGLLADKIGGERLMKGVAVVFMVAAYPLFSFLEQDFSITRVVIVQLVLGVMSAGFVAPNMVVMRTFFPVRQQYSGIAFGSALGDALLGGTTPLILVTLTGWTHPTFAYAGYLMFGGLIGLLAILFAQKYND